MYSDSAIKRVLIYRIGSLGDTIVALPCFHLVERTFPGATRVLLTNFPVHAKAPPSAAVLDGSGLVQDYMRYTIGTRSPLELLRLALEVRRFNPDALIYLMPLRSMQGVKRDMLFFKLACGIRQILGLPKEEDLRRVRNLETDLYESEATRLARTLVDLGEAAPHDLANWSLRLTESEMQMARSSVGDLAGEPLIVCGPGTKMQAKDWGKDNWRALLGQLTVCYPGYGLALVGAKEDMEVSEYASRAWRGRKVNLCGRLNLRGTAAVLEHASVFIGPDSGPMHLAACAGVPCVIAFSARGLPGVWYPAGRQHRILYRRVSCLGCNLESCIVEGRRCLTSITVEEMVAATRSVLI